MKRVICGLFMLCFLSNGALAFNQNPAQGSVYTYLGPSLGADWLPPPTFNNIAGMFAQVNQPPSSLSTWLNSNLISGKNPYGYLAQYSLFTTPTNYGEMAIVGASRTSDNVFAPTCCSIGLVGVAVNDNTLVGHIQTAWPLYTTGMREDGSGAIQNEMDVANVGTETVDITPYVGPTNGPPGSSTTLYLGAGGEPCQIGVTCNPNSAVLVIAPNGGMARRGIVGIAGLFPVSYCTTNCPFIDMAEGYEVRWSGTTGNEQAFVRGLSFSAGTGNGIEIGQNGSLFKNSSGGILATVAETTGPMSNVGYATLGSSGNDAAIAVGNGNGATSANLQLAGLGTGGIWIQSTPRFIGATTGSSTPPINNSPCTGVTTRWVPVNLSTAAGTWYAMVCQ